MRGPLGLALVLCAALGSPVAVAHGQPTAPVPEVRITGFIDTVTSWVKNTLDTQIHRTGDREWYARSRGRFDVVGQVGEARGVLGIEIDSVWGQVSGADNNLAAGGVNRQHFGATSAFDLNTDTQGSIEVKWLYTEFPLPLLPFPTTVRLGAQPFLTLYKFGVYATGDFAGASIDMNFTRNLRAHLTYVAIEENLTGGRRSLGFGNGDDWAMIASVELVPLKGLELQALYSFVQIYGNTTPSARVSTAANPFPIPVTFSRANPGGALGAGQVENRHTVGVDARWRSGPFSLDPTILYQFGDRDTDNPFVADSSSAKDRITEARIDAWFIDIIGGWRIGSLLLEGRYVYTTGNRPKDQLNRDVNYYQPLDTDTGYWSGWGEIYGLGIDYFNTPLRGMGNQVTFDRYGRQQFAVRAIYSVTPDLDLRAIVSPGWTARSVDTDAPVPFIAPPTLGPVLCNPDAAGKGAGCKGDASYIGTEVVLGLTWRMAPGLALDVAGAVLFPGGALDASEGRNGILTKVEAKNMYLLSGRIRYSF